MLAGCLFPGEGYDGILRIAFGMPGLDLKPGTKAPTGPALSKATALSGEQVTRRAFELDAARSDVDLGIGSACHGMETTSFDGTAAEVFNCDELADAFGVPAGGTKPKVRIVAHVRTGSRRWIGAAVGGYHDGENTLVDELGGTLRPGMLNLADRVLLHGPVDPVLRHRGAAVLAGQERRQVRAVQDPQDPPRRLRAGPSPRVERDAGQAPPRRRRQERTAPARYRRPADPVHGRDPLPQRAASRPAPSGC